MRQHFTFIGLKPRVIKTCKACNVCRSLKKRFNKYGLVPPKEPQAIPWHTLCVDLIGPYQWGSKEKGTAFSLTCLTMIDPATGWFEICEVPNKRADYIVNYLEQHWLTRYPWPTEIVMDRGTEFCAEVAKAIRDQFGVTKKLITSRNPQANSIVERIHQVVGNMLDTRGITCKADLDEHFGFSGILAAIRHTINALVHATTRATPSQLVFGRDKLLNVNFVADWQYIKDRKQRLILQNNKRENKTRIPHVHNQGDRVMVKLDPSRKHDGDKYQGPYTVTQVCDNGTVKLSRNTNGGAVYETWNIRNIDPCLD
jgi:hypothetical protein